jgi:hypothetical protein
LKIYGIASLSHFYDRFLKLIRLEGKKILVAALQLKDELFRPLGLSHKSCANMM